MEVEVTVEVNVKLSLSGRCLPTKLATEKKDCAPISSLETDELGAGNEVGTTVCGCLGLHMHASCQLVEDREARDWADEAWSVSINRAIPASDRGG